MYDAVIEAARKHGASFAQNAPMSKLTSFHTGGAAALLVQPNSVAAVQDILSACREEHAKFCVIGNGSNLLVSDAGFSGVVLRIGPAMAAIEDLGNGRIRCAAGASLTALCNFACRQGLSGLEFAFGIPGTAGGAAYMNAGAYGGEMKDVLTACTHVASDGSLGSFTGKALALSYRRSVYTDKDLIITGLELQLQPGDPNVIRAAMDENMRKRTEKQPLEFPSAGSTFKRPQGYFAGALIEQSGLKGVSVGGAQVSEKHAGFVINTGTATTSDILSLIELIRQTVWEKFGVRLEPEVKYIGD